MNYKASDLVKIAQRENNKKRNYLVVNRMQAKHIPAEPGEALAMFQALSEPLKKVYQNETLLVIGFAETATAIGAAVAAALDASYMQTTREQVPGADYLFFCEEHSHATQQKLVKDDLDQVIGRIDRILFVEDEVTTGKTILNMIDKIRMQYPQKVAFAAASILNGMDQAALETYRDQGIDIFYLVKTDHHAYAKAARQYADTNPPSGHYYPCKTDRTITVPEIRIGGCVNARRMVSAAQYQKACGRLWHAVDDRLHDELQGRVLVLGTEEFMYPALYTAARIAESGAQVRCHATTRSPILVYADADYPLHERYELRSLYDRQRKTFLYDLDTYQAVLILTDAQNEESEGIRSLIHAVSMKNECIFLVRWSA